MENYFDDSLLANFADTFYGYSDYKGHYWFIGMEEGGGDSFDNVNKRLSVWNADGRPELEDVAKFHHALGLGKFFKESPKLQPTWNKLIRILLSAKGQENVQTEQVREYQRSLLGRVSEEENCLIELLPLPSRSTHDWIYVNHSKLSCLKDRDKYKECYMHKRAKHIQERIDQYKPRVVVFYSTTKEYLEQWKQIAEAPFTFDHTKKLYVARRNGTLFVITDHPARWWRHSYFHNAGRQIASELATSHTE
jgi:hypothetical protein